MTSPMTSDSALEDAAPRALVGKRVVWSREHNAWWRANRKGYCVELLGAGLYTEAEADAICDANSDRREVHFCAVTKWRELVSSISPNTLGAAATQSPLAFLAGVDVEALAKRLILARNAGDDRLAAFVLTWDRDTAIADARAVLSTLKGMAGADNG